MPISKPSIPAVLAERAQQRPDAPAYTFIDYQLDPAGYAETLTWSEVHQRAHVVAAELALWAKVPSAQKRLRSIANQTE